MTENKLAVFVEGQAEQIFVKKLIEQIAGAQNVKIVPYKAQGGGRAGPRRLVRLTGERVEPAVQYYVQIVDCSNDEKVASDICANYDKLVEAQYKAIIGIRDVYPKLRANIHLVRRGMAYGQKTKPIMVDNVLAVMEVESWFLGEHNHFARIGPGIAVTDIINAFSFDPSIDNMEERNHPAADLHAVYELGGCSYAKRAAEVQSTVDALDYENIYFTLADRMSSLRQLVDAIERFLAS